MHIAGVLFCSGLLISATNLKMAVWSSLRINSQVQRSRSSFRTTCMFQLDYHSMEMSKIGHRVAQIWCIWWSNIWYQSFSHHISVLASVPTWLMITKTSWKAKTCWWPTMMWTMRRTPRVPTTGGTGRTWTQFWHCFLRAIFQTIPLFCVFFFTQSIPLV